MEDQTGNTSRTLTTLKRASSDSTTKSDEEGVDNQKCRYEKDDGSRKEMSQNQPSSQSTTKQKIHKEDDGSSDEGYPCVISSDTETSVKLNSDKRFNTDVDKESSKETEKQRVAEIQRIRLQYDCCMMFLENIVKETDYFESLGLNTSYILQNVREKLGILLKYTKIHNISIEQNLDWFQQRLFDIYVNCNPYKHKTIEAPKIINKYRTLCPVVIREAKID